MPLGQTATHCYDSDNRLRKSRYSDGRIETFSYDAVGKDHPVLLVDWRAGAPFIDNYGDAYNADYLGRVVKKHLRLASIDVPSGAHLLRHAMVTHMLENGADIRFIQAMLGHTDLRATEVYTRVSVAKLREIHRAIYPAKVKKKG